MAADLYRPDREHGRAGGHHRQPDGSPRGRLRGVLAPPLTPAGQLLPGRRHLARGRRRRRPLRPREGAGRPADLTREPWVFEYKKGETFSFPDGAITTPRANRAIITTAVQGPERRFHADIHRWLPQLGADLDVAFLAGYHQCGDRPDDLDAVRRYIDESRQDWSA